MQTKCPHCQTVQNAPDDAIGKKARCRSCREVFVLTQVLQDQGSVESLAAVSNDLPKTLNNSTPSSPTPHGYAPRCPRCGTSIVSFAYHMDDNTLICFRCLCELRKDDVDAQIVPTMPPGRVLRRVVCWCGKGMWLPQDANYAKIVCPFCFGLLPVKAAKSLETSWQASVRVALWTLVWIQIILIVMEVLAALLVPGA